LPISFSIKLNCWYTYPRADPATHKQKAVTGDLHSIKNESAVPDGKMIAEFLQE
jgi:hypothetical protein